MKKRETQGSGLEAAKIYKANSLYWRKNNSLLYLVHEGDVNKEHHVEAYIHT